ncbi:ABC transporter ATP-binding protein [Inquilinus sp.]|jgi:ABC-2 type transport system ATP-binding protein|uniref:ABC transporter ATP-binding protein n=1 Tax=Inquilinus sp. TaxID=1932117 RepID=UPI0037838F1A
MIRADRLHRRFGPVVAVADVSLEIGRGEVVGLLGPNGAGKSTLLRMLVGYLEPDAGAAALDGIDVQRRPIAARRRLGYLPEGAPLYPEMTPAGLLDFVAGVHGLVGRARRAAVEAAAERVELGPMLRRPIETLSKGYRRRTALAAALLPDPPILILDEPTDGLDPNQKQQMHDAIREMGRDKAILVSTHVLEEVEAMCSRAVILAAGQIRADDTPAALAARSPDGRLAGLFRALTLPDAPPLPDTHPAEAA